MEAGEFRAACEAVTLISGHTINLPASVTVGKFSSPGGHKGLMRLICTHIFILCFQDFNVSIK